MHCFKFPLLWKQPPSSRRWFHGWAAPRMAEHYSLACYVHRCSMVVQDLSAL